MAHPHTQQHFDLLILGAGPGGYVAAIRGAQLGLKVGVVDKATEGLGGTCLNVGCIPSKALLHASHLAHSVTTEAPEWGITCAKVTIDVPTLQAQKRRNVAKLVEGIEYLLKKNKVTFVPGWATFQDSKTLIVDNQGATSTVTADAIIIATGSTPAGFPGVSVDETTIVSSTGCLAFETAPQSLVILGGGYIGVEMASVWARLGTKVTIVEYADRLVPAMDADISAGLLKALKKLGITIHLGTQVNEVNRPKKGKGVALACTVVSTQEALTLEAEKLMIAIGRRPNTEGLGLEHAGIHCTEKGFIEVSPTLQTHQPHIWAIGDVIGGMMLAHKAEHEGVMVVEGIVNGHFYPTAPQRIPAVIFTTPEAAAVGWTEAELTAQGIPFKVGKFLYAANSRARAVGASEGFVKMLVHASTDHILGVHIMGEAAGTLIAEATLALEYSASAQDIADTCHPHPTFSEALKEAALACLGHAIHS